MESFNRDEPFGPADLVEELVEEDVPGAPDSEDDEELLDEDASEMPPDDPYPAADFITLEVKTDPSREDEQEYETLNRMKAKDVAFKNSLYNDQELQDIYGSIYTRELKVSFYTDERSLSMVQQIEDGLENRVAFAVRQRRFVAELYKKGQLAYDASAWNDASLELIRTHRIASIWNTKRLNLYWFAIQAEQECSIDDLDFDRGMRRCLSQLLDEQKEVAAVMEEEEQQEEKGTVMEE